MKLMIQWAVTSSALILIVLAVRRLFREKLSARLKYALWGVVLLRLLVPFQVELPADTSAALPLLATNLAQDVTPRLEDTMLYAVPTRVYPNNGGVQPGEPPEYSRTLHGGVGSDWEYYSGGVVYDEDGITRYFFMMPASELLMMIWKAGAGLCLLVILYSNWGFSLRLGRRRRRLEVPDAPIQVYVAEGLPSPCLFGVFRPAVYVTPEAAEDPDTLRHVLAHELTHYAHRDHLWSLLRCLALALHWYNPLVWLAVVLSKQDGELACDEGAVARLGEAERIPYGRTLVDMVAARSLRPGDLLSCSTAMTGGGKSVKQRVAQLVKKPETVKVALFAVIALVALSVVFVFAGRGPSRQENTMLLDYLDRTAAIRYCPPLYSSTFYPNPITKEDLLAQAKEALSDFRYLEDNDPQPVLDGKEVIRESRIILTFEGGEMEYSLLWQNDYTYLFAGSILQQDLDLKEQEGETAQLLGVSGTCISRQGDNVISVLEGLARLSTRNAEPASPELEAFLADLDNASSIRYYPPSYSSQYYPEAITDPRLLANARERLSNLVPLEAEDATPDGKHLLDASRIVLTTEEGEVTYSLIPWNDYTYVARGSGDYSVQENGRTAYLRTSGKTNLSGSIASLARTQELLSQDPLTPVPMTRAELGGYSLADICETLGYQLQGWSGDPEEAVLVNGFTTQDRVLLWYNGDETHFGYWVLELLAPGFSADSSGYTVVSDQPEVVRNAPLYRLNGSGWKDFEVMTPDIFAVCLRPKDVVSVTAGDYDPGQEVTVDIPALREQLTQALYHQFSGEYDREKHGLYVLTIRVKGSGTESYLGYEIAEDADRLTLSAGSEKDVVCLSHRNFATTPEPTRLFVRSPELYRTVRDLFD